MDFSTHPVKILQFGEGNFLRAFADFLIDRSNESGDFGGSIAVIKPRGDKPLEVFDAQSCRYTVAVRGMDEDGIVEEDRTVTSLSCAINPNLEPERYDALCIAPQLRFILSNTTEAGIRFDETDSMDAVPFTFPGRITKLLYDRFVHFSGDESKGLYLLPCELIDHNGAALKACVLRYAALWGLDDGFTRWIEKACFFCDTLVDRIVSGYPADPAPFHERLGWEDQLLTVCEPFYLWVIQEMGDVRREFPVDRANSGVLFAADVTAYKERKVRLLNGAHTALTPIALLSGKECVDEVMSDPVLAPFLDGLYSEEILPAFRSLPRGELEGFAEAVKLRFRNPFLHHRWEAISLNSWSKFVARLLPTVRDSQAVPQRVALAFAALAELYCKTQRNDDGAILEFFKHADRSRLLDALVDEPAFGLEELKEMAGILKPSQVGKIVEKGEYKSLEEIEDILPFLDEETTEKLARKAVKEENYRNLECVAPFINKNVLDKIACEVYEKNGLTAIEEILPFISSEQRKKIADREYKMSGLKNFEDIAPFLNRDYLNQLAKEAIEKDGIKAISNIAPFIGREVLAEYVKEQYL